MIRLKKIASNLHQVMLPNIIICFSYETPIAFTGAKAADKLVITKNIWSSTTGKHLNIINDDKSIRIDNHEFNKLLQEAIK